MSAVDRAHTRWLAGDLAYPDDVAAQVNGHLDDVATHANRGEIVDAVAAAYAAVGVHEDWLAFGVGERRMTTAASQRIEARP